MLVSPFISIWPYEGQTDARGQGWGEIALRAAWRVGGVDAAVIGRSHCVLAGIHWCCTLSPTKSFLLMKKLQTKEGTDSSVEEHSRRLGFLCVFP